MKTPLLLPLIAILAPACSLTGIKGSGTIEIQDRPVPAFNAIAVRGSGEMLLSQGDTHEVSIECDDNLLEYIESEVDGMTLSLGPVGANLSPSDRIIYRVVVKDLDSIALSGSLRMHCPALKTEDLTVRTSGSGRVRIGQLNGKAVGYRVSGSGDLRVGSLYAEKLTLKISGSGDVEVEEGAVNTMNARISGSGDLGLRNLHTQKAMVKITGSGKAQLWVDQEIEANISGSGKIEHWGSAVVEQHTSGSARIIGMGANE